MEGLLDIQSVDPTPTPTPALLQHHTLGMDAFRNVKICAGRQEGSTESHRSHRPPCQGELTLTAT
jgi:hypothetical protein